VVRSLDALFIYDSHTLNVLQWGTNQKLSDPMSRVFCLWLHAVYVVHFRYSATALVEAPVGRSLGLARSKKGSAGVTICVDWTTCLAIESVLEEVREVAGASRQDSYMAWLPFTIFYRSEFPPSS
jgi:hypothetical protein